MRALACDGCDHICNPAVAAPVRIGATLRCLMYHDVYGVFNDLLVDKLHLLPRTIAWVADPSTSLAALAAVDIWMTTPFVALLLLAGLQ